MLLSACSSLFDALHPLFTRSASCPSLSARFLEVGDLIAVFAGFLLATFTNGRLIADVTHTTTQGKHRAALGFRKNQHYHKGYRDQSKFLTGNDALSLACLADEMQENGRIQHYYFALGGILRRLSNKKKVARNRAMFEQLSGLRRKDKLFSTTVSAMMPRPSNNLGENYLYFD